MGGVQWRLLSAIWETPPTGGEGEIFILQGLFENLHIRVSQSGGALLAMQMHYNECKGYPAVDVEDESAYSVPVALWSVSPKVLEATGSGYWAPRLIMCRLIYHWPCLQPMSPSCPFKGLGLCLGGPSTAHV